MYCKGCGKQIDDNATTCPYCGTVTGGAPKTGAICKNCGSRVPVGAQICPFCRLSTGLPKLNTPNGEDDYVRYDTGGFGWALLGFLVSPIIALILYLVMKNEFPAKASSIGKGAVTGIIVSVILIIILVVVAVSNADNYYQVFDKFTAMINR